MTGREKLSVNKHMLKAIAAGFAVLLCLLMLAGCTSMTDAEKKVSKELKALQESDSIGSEVITLRDSLSDEGRKNFDGPRGKMMPMPKDGKNKFPGKEFNKDGKKDFPGKKFPGGEFKKGELKEGEVPAPKPVAPKEAPKDAGEKKVK